MLIRDAIVASAELIAETIQRNTPALMFAIKCHAISTSQATSDEEKRAAINAIDELGELMTNGYNENGFASVSTPRGRPSSGPAREVKPDVPD